MTCGLWLLVLLLVPCIMKIHAFQVEIGIPPFSEMEVSIEIASNQINNVCIQNDQSNIQETCSHFVIPEDDDYYITSMDMKSDGLSVLDACKQSVLDLIPPGRNLWRAYYVQHCIMSLSIAQFTSILPQGYGIKVGRGTEIKVIVYCAHSHVHKTYDRRATHPARAVLELLRAADEPDIKNTAIFGFGNVSMASHGHGRISMKTVVSPGENKRIRVFKVVYHTHIPQYTPASITLSLFMDGSEKVIEHVSHIDKSSLVTYVDKTLNIHESDMIALNCEFMGTIPVEMVPLYSKHCFGYLVYETGHEPVLHRNQYIPDFSKGLFE